MSFLKLFQYFFKASAFLLTLSERKNRLLIHDMIQYLQKANIFTHDFGNCEI